MRTMTRWIPFAAGLALVAACSDGTSTQPAGVTFGTPASSIVTSSPTSAGNTVATTQPAAPTTTTVPAQPATTPAPTLPPTTVPLGDPVVSVNRLGDFDQPIDVSYRPDGTTYVAEQDGLVVMMKDGQPDLLALDMTDLTSAAGERGLLGLAISP
ncbi:MAG TPA: hypothetical protein VH761_02660, partial [Ilumatobacteraceae bacterium]